MNDLRIDHAILQHTSEYRDERYETGHKPRPDEDGEILENSSKPPNSPIDTDKSSMAPSQAGTAADDEEFSMLPTRWWYAQTAFPLCAGTFGPMANAFSICALVQNWRVEITPGLTESNGINLPDQTWLIVVNAVSLGCALIANLSLLLNMARRLSFSVAQSITILGFWISSVLLIGLIAASSHNSHSPTASNQALTQAYYYACWAAGLYQIIAYLMCITVYGAVKNKYDREFKLTTAQRSLMLQTISFLAYLLIGALIFCHLEDWSYLDAVYWADFTLLTIGIGDYAPTTHAGRSLLFPFAVGGIVVLGLVVSSIRSLILDRGKQKLSVRMTERIRREVVKEVQKASEGREKIRGRRVGVSSEMVKRIAVGPSEDADLELERRKAEFQAMRKVQYFSERRQKWMNLFVSGSAWAMLWFLGAVVFMYTERDDQNWSYFQAMYFAYTSLLTIGYGDLSPVSNSGKAFFVFWSLLAIPSLTIVISDMSDTVVRIIKDATIWLGEITILPSSEGSIRKSLEHGLAKATFRPRDKFHVEDSNKNHKDRPKSGASQSHDSPWSWRTLLQRTKKHRTSDESANENSPTASDLDKFETTDERKVQVPDDTLVDDQDQHHYRRLLISTVRTLYADSRHPKPKRYTYNEWTYFLKLLGQDESSSIHHQSAPLRSVPHGTNRLGQPLRRHHVNSDQKSFKWSWIGPQSPLTSEKHEPALLLEMFFERLEFTLRKEEDKLLSRVDENIDENLDCENASVSEGGGSSDGNDVADIATSSRDEGEGDENIKSGTTNDIFNDQNSKGKATK